MRRSLLVLSLLLVACGRRKAALEALETPVAVAAAPSTSASARGPELLGGATCAWPEPIDRDVEVAAGCVVDVPKRVVIGDGHTLTIGAGAVLRFHPATWLEVGLRGSRLVAKGTVERPIRFTSALAEPAPGDWIGLVFEEAVGEGTVVEHAVVEYAGRASHGGQGAVTVFRAFPPGRVALRDVVFRKNATTAIHDPHPQATFGAFERNVLEDEHAMRVSAGVLAALGANNRIAGTIEILGGTVRGQGTFPKTLAGLHVRQPISVEGQEGKPASLEIEKGAVLRFDPLTWLEVGTTGPADLSAAGVTFTSAAPQPAAGDWVGLLFGDHARRVRVRDSTIEYAGAEEHGGDAAVTFVGTRSWQAHDVVFSFVTFRSIQQAHFSSNGDGCDKALDPRYGMVWAGLLEPCR